MVAVQRDGLATAVCVTGADFKMSSRCWSWFLELSLDPEASFFISLGTPFLCALLHGTTQYFVMPPHVEPIFNEQVVAAPSRLL